MKQILLGIMMFIVMVALFCSCSEPAAERVVKYPDESVFRLEWDPTEKTVYRVGDTLHVTARLVNTDKKNDYKIDTGYDTVRDNESAITIQLSRDGWNNGIDIMGISSTLPFNRNGSISVSDLCANGRWYTEGYTFTEPGDYKLGVFASFSVLDPDNYLKHKNYSYYLPQISITVTAA